MPDRLEQRLSALAAEIDFPTTPDLAPAVTARAGEPTPRRRRMRPARRSLALALGALAVLAAGAGAVPAVRDAVGDLLGLDGATVERVPRLPASPGGLDLGRPVTLEEAAGVLRFAPAVPGDARLGAPDGVYLRGRGQLAQVTLLWRPSGELPALGPSRAGLLLTQFRGDLSPDLVGKFIGPNTGTRRVRVQGSPGFWIEGRHAFAYRDASGLIRTEELRRAESALLWTRGRVLMRLEAALPLQRALEIARGVR
jgi:hypothetical protein